jgi:hypothetical protein
LVLGLPSEAHRFEYWGRHRPVARLADEHTEGVGRRSGFLVESGQDRPRGVGGERVGSSELPLGITGTDGPLPHQPTHQGSSGMKGVYILKLDGGRKNLAILYTQ